jgi:hypothetical protein
LFRAMLILSVVVGGRSMQTAYILQCTCQT